MKQHDKILLDTTRTFHERRGNTRRPRQYRDIEDAPERESIRMRQRDMTWLYDGPRSKPTALIRFLESRVGQSWAKIYSDICEVVDRRTEAGHHFMETLDGFVDASGNWPRVGVCKFSVDRQGRLQHTPGYGSWRHYRGASRSDANRKKIGERCLQKLDGLWFEVGYRYVPKELALVRKEWPSTFRDLWDGRVEIAHRIKQLNSRELRRFGLENDPPVA